MRKWLLVGLSSYDEGLRRSGIIVDQLVALASSPPKLTVLFVSLQGDPWVFRFSS